MATHSHNSQSSSSLTFSKKPRPVRRDDCLVQDCQNLAKLDYESPFRDIFDAVDRLLPFHVSSPSFAPEKLAFVVDTLLGTELQNGECFFEAENIRGKFRPTKSGISNTVGEGSDTTGVVRGVFREGQTSTSGRGVPFREARFAVCS